MQAERRGRCRCPRLETPGRVQLESQRCQAARLTEIQFGFVVQTVIFQVEHVQLAGLDALAEIEITDTKVDGNGKLLEITDCTGIRERLIFGARVDKPFTTVNEKRGKREHSDVNYSWYSFHGFWVGRMTISLIKLLDSCARSIRTAWATSEG